MHCKAYTYLAEFDPDMTRVHDPKKHTIIHNLTIYTNNPLPRKISPPDDDDGDGRRRQNDTQAAQASIPLRRRLPGFEPPCRRGCGFRPQRTRARTTIRTE